MNFVEFKEKIVEMECKLKEENINLGDIKIEYTKLDGYNCIWAMKEDNVISHFKW